MEREVCMNISCNDDSVCEWKKGWPLITGGFARLCNKCGTAYENSIFCDQFHYFETGWRECSSCNKRIHCGCIVSKNLYQYFNFGGIGCATCVKTSQLRPDTENPNRFFQSTTNNAGDHYAEQNDGRLQVENAGNGKFMQLCRTAEACESSIWPQAHRDDIFSYINPKSQEVKYQFREEDKTFSNLMKRCGQSLTFPTLQNNKPTWETKSRHEPLSLSMSLGNSSATEFVTGRVEGKATSSFFHGTKPHTILPKPSNIGVTMNPETNKGMISQLRNLRPPADAKGKNQLLSRYWPKITDQELEQLSGDLKSDVVPLFEKVLSASDAGRIGRLVLPKACAEAYFPAISQSDGVPLHFQDAKGNEWTFQFRFWPNNNSRMYVLEGVTPCIQSMKLNAGDTVTFSRIDPGGKFVLGFRKASNSIDTKEASTYVHSNNISTKDTNFFGATRNLQSGSNYSDLFQSKRGNGEPYINGHSENLRLLTGTGTANWLNCEEVMNSDTLQHLFSVSEKRSRNIGPKTKRLVILDEDAEELRVTWKEAQDLLSPPPNVKPNIVTIEDHVFEEYDEPPVFGKSTITTDASPSGSSCSALDQLSPLELECQMRNSKDFKKLRTVEKSKLIQDQGGLDALASAAVLGENLDDTVEPSAGITTKHPRHRPGCTCIVCIQPPSGQGKHKPTCDCLACVTVRRRFNTIMMRKKKKQSEPEAVADQNDHQVHHRDEPDTSQSPEERRQNRAHSEEAQPNAAGKIDLNCHPNHEDMEVDT